jgi:acyl carrier protein
MATEQDIRAAVRSFITTNIPDALTLADDANLISTRLMDSIVALKLVNYLEETFKIEFEAHEVVQENLDSINIIVSFVQSKMK